MKILTSAVKAEVNIAVKLENENIEYIHLRLCHREKLYVINCFVIAQLLIRC